MYIYIDSCICLPLNHFVFSSKCVFLDFPIHMVMMFHLWLEKVLFTGAFLQLSLSLNGRESSIIAEALCSLGHHISQGLHKCLGMENLIVAEAFLLTGAFLVMVLDISVHVWAVLNGFSAGFYFLVLKV